MAGVFDILSDEETTARVSWRQTSRESASAWLRKRMAAEAEHGLSMWAVEMLKNRELIGLCGFLPRPKDDDLELGFVIKACYWGNGYATEAVRAAVGAVVGEERRVYATIRPWNVGSIVVAERAGLKPDGELQDERGTLIVYRSQARPG